MKISGASCLLCLLALSGCAPEVIELAAFGIDAGDSAPLDASAPVEGELDAEPQAIVDAALDTGRMQSELDARARGDAERGTGCSSKEDCAVGQVCDLVGCGPNKSGTCVPAQECEVDKFDPVCDCNGFKYLNDCERRQHGVARDRECTMQRPPCTGPGTCPLTPEGLPTHCGWPAQRSSTTGQCRGQRACFVLPDCSSLFGAAGSSFRAVYAACDPKVSGAAYTMGFEFCMSACDAIELGEQFAPTQPTRCLVAPRTGGGAGGPGFAGSDLMP
jgi:hypothetical protein